MCRRILFWRFSMLSQRAPLYFTTTFTFFLTPENCLDLAYSLVVKGKESRILMSDLCCHYDLWRDFSFQMENYYYTYFQLWVSQEFLRMITSLNMNVDLSLVPRLGMTSEKGDHLRWPWWWNGYFCHLTPIFPYSPAMREGLFWSKLRIWRDPCDSPCITQESSDWH